MTCDRLSCVLAYPSPPMPGLYLGFRWFKCMHIIRDMSMCFKDVMIKLVTASAIVICKRDGT